MDALQVWTARKQDDDEELFGRSIAAQLRQLSNRAKSAAKFNIQKVSDCVKSAFGEHTLVRNSICFRRCMMRSRMI